MSDQTTFAPTASADPAVPGDPFIRLRYHYGMLLGAEDFSVEQREKVLRRRLHQALLHGAGTVWGLRVAVGEPGDDGLVTRVIVQPGLAVDVLGRDVFVEQNQCLDVIGLGQNPIWATLKDPDEAHPSTARRAYVVLRYEACLSQPVPAITAPCSDPGDAVAYGRLLDRYRIDLEAEPPPDPHALQRDWLAAVLAANPAASPREVLLEYLLGPAKEEAGEDPRPPLERFWRTQIDAPLLLATLDLDVVGAGAAASTHVIVSAANPDNRVRALLPSVQLVAESLFGDRLLGAPLPTEAVPAPFRVEAWKVIDARHLRVKLSAKPHLGALASKPVALYRLDAGGWTDLSANLSALTFDEPTSELVLELDTDLGVAPVTYQIHIAGSSPAPLVAADGAPLVGLAGDPLTRRGQGRDVTIIDTWKP